MPKIGNKDEMQVMKVANSNFQFSGIRPERLESTEYTLVSILVDKSGSVQSFVKELVESIKAVVEACNADTNPRRENLLIRVTYFNSQIEEVHGFLTLDDIDVSLYENMSPYGCTALFDGAFESIGSVLKYSEDLQEQEMSVNGICVFITDGEDNDSKATPGMIRKQVEDALKAETVIESLMTILVGINADDCRVALEDFKNRANLQQFVNAGDATPKTLAKLAKFVSQSISSQSQSLGTGGPSQSLSF